MAHGDYTGNTKIALTEKFRKEQQLRASSMAMVSQVVDEAKQDVINLIPGGYSTFEDYQMAKDAEKRMAEVDRMKRLQEMYPNRYPAAAADDAIDVDEP